MQIYDTTLVDAAVELVGICGEHHTMVPDDIRRPTHGCCRIVAVFGHLISSTGNDEAGRSGDVESILAVATRTDNVYIPVAVEQGRDTRGQYAIPKSQQLVYAYTTHLQTGQQGCNLLIGNLLPCNG